MIFGAILAGGVGSRMQMADMPKQFLPLGEKPIIIHTLEKFLTCDKFECVYLGVHSNWITHTRDLIRKYVPNCQDRIQIVAGGSGRNDTIQNIIAAIEEKYGEHEDDIIVSHDAVRPFITMRILQENIAGALEFGATDTVVPAVDTIVVSQDGKVISDIPNRAQLYQGQTPQSFRIQLLKKLYNNLSEEEKEILTDACKICVLQNYPVHLVMGEYTNLKITTPGDYKIAQAMVGGKILD